MVTHFIIEYITPFLSNALSIHLSQSHDPYKAFKCPKLDDEENQRLARPVFNNVLLWMYSSLRPVLQQFSNKDIEENDIEENARTQRQFSDFLVDGTPI